jgi:hypothetical protein
LPALMLVALGCGSCGSLNPAFVDLLAPELSAGLTTIDNPPGHVIIAVANNATVNERIVTYLESEEGGSLVLPEDEKRNIKPLIRFRVRVTFTDETEQVFEFIQGSRFVDTRYQAQAEQDFRQQDFTNSVVVCNVARVEFLPLELAPIEVYMPVFIDFFRFQPATENREAFDQLEQTTSPGFIPLEVDSTGLQANIGVRNLPATLETPVCGSVVTIVVEGELSVPFQVTDTPSVYVDDPQTNAAIGGRYSFLVSSL